MRGDDDDDVDDDDDDDDVDDDDDDVDDDDDDDDVDDDDDDDDINENTKKMRGVCGGQIQKAPRDWEGTKIEHNITV